MPKQTVIIFLSLSLLMLVAGCARFPEKVEERNSPLTAGNVSMTIIKGVTSKSEIMSEFGAPNLVTKNRSTDEVWNYNRMNFTTRVGRDGGTAIFWSGSRAMATATTKSIDLIITFDENDIVKDYSVIQASY